MTYVRRMKAFWGPLGGGASPISQTSDPLEPPIRLLSLQKCGLPPCYIVLHESHDPSVDPEMDSSN